MILYQSTRDLSASAQITYNNMRTYYEHYAVNWEQPTIVEQITGLENWDIVCDGEVVGAIRLAREYGVKQLRLRVFKISPAYHLYTRCGFTIASADDRFFNMIQNIT